MMPRFEPVYCFYPILKSTMTLILKWPLVVCVLALFCGGCGSAAYEEQFAKRSIHSTAKSPSVIC